MSYPSHPLHHQQTARKIAMFVIDVHGPIESGSPLIPAAQLHRKVCERRHTPFHARRSQTDSCHPPIQELSVCPAKQAAPSKMGWSPLIGHHHNIKLPAFVFLQCVALLLVTRSLSPVLSRTKLASLRWSWSSLASSTLFLKSLISISFASRPARLPTGSSHATSRPCRTYFSSPWLPMDGELRLLSSRQKVRSS